MLFVACAEVGDWLAAELITARDGNEKGNRILGSGAMMFQPLVGIEEKFRDDNLLPALSSALGCKGVGRVQWVSRTQEEEETGKEKQKTAEEKKR